ncbi:MAG: helix-turn-helix transcriptional regulator [Lentisphaeria bacterium]|nr:helix-turn-helix transcriptional regulator [Lentisphaeria bacterium]
MNQSTDGSGPVSVRRIRMEDLSAARPAGSYLIRVAESGCGVAVCSGVPALLIPGTAMLLRPGAVPEYGMLTDPVFLDFYFDEEAAVLMRSAAPAFAEGDLRTVPAEILPRIAHLAEEIERESQRRKPGYQLALLEKILSLDRMLFRHGRPPREAEKQVARSLMFMEENYSRDITLHDLAELTGLSVSYYRRIFHSLLGESPIDFLVGLRLRHAEQLLARPGLSIAEVARETGFSDPNYFSRVFSRSRGMPPREWRRSASKN